MRACNAGRPWLVPVFVTKQDNDATAAMASIEDAAEYGERADVLVSGLLGRVMRQRRTSRRRWITFGRCRGRRGRLLELAQRAGHEGPYRMQALFGPRVGRG